VQGTQAGGGAIAYHGNYSFGGLSWPFYGNARYKMRLQSITTDNMLLLRPRLMFFSSAFVALSLNWFAYASIGPVADLHIVNKYISPDGFNRS
jgi:hypothetical protein